MKTSAATTHVTKSIVREAPAPRRAPRTLRAVRRRPGEAEPDAPATMEPRGPYRVVLSCGIDTRTRNT